MELSTLQKANMINNRIDEVTQLLEQSDANEDNTSITPMVIQMGMANAINFSIINQDEIDMATDVDKLNQEMYNEIVKLLISYKEELDKIFANI